MYIEALTYVFSIFIFILVYKLDRTHDKVLSFVSFPSIFILVFSLVRFDEYQQYIHFNNFSLTYVSYLSVSILVISYVIGFFIPYFLKLNINGRLYINDSVDYSLKRINLFIFITFSFSLLALILNLSNVGFNINLMFEGARDYEKSFGENWLVNYMYFLHVPCMILIVFKNKIKGKSSVIDIAIFTLALLFSIFHGIKFTVFDALFFPLLFYVSINELSKKSKLFFISVIFTFVIFFAFFSFLVRGGGDDFNLFAIVDYLVPNYINLFYVLEMDGIIFSYPFDAYLGGLTLLIDIPRNLPQVDFLVNYKYNMVTGYPHILADFFYVLSFLFFTSMICIFIYFRNSNSLLGGFICSYILFSLLMMCYAYYFGAKYKYIYYFIVFFIINFLCKIKPTSKIKL